MTIKHISQIWADVQRNRIITQKMLIELYPKQRFNVMVSMKKNHYKKNLNRMTYEVDIDLLNINLFGERRSMLSKKLKKFERKVKRET